MTAEEALLAAEAAILFKVARHPCRHPLADAAKRMAGDGTGEHPSVANAVGAATAATAAADTTAATTTAAAAAAAARSFSSRAALFITRRPFRSGLLLLPGRGTWRRGSRAAPLEAAQAHTPCVSTREGTVFSLVHTADTRALYLVQYLRFIP